MPFIETKRDDIKALKGVHLFHFATSNCSQRVRFVLEEKGVGWTSHHIDLTKCENATPEFVALNPKGVVPVLVHDGRTLTESNDIIRYIDEFFPGPALRPDSDEDNRYLETSLEQSSAYQVPLKLLMHEFLFKPVRRMNEQELETYSKGTQSADLTKFMREFSSKEGFSREKIARAVRDTEAVLADLESRLQASPWLTGKSFGLTDISWVVNIHRFSYMHYPQKPYPAVSDWLERMRARPGFRSAITSFESKKMSFFFATYTMLRRLRRTSIEYYVFDKI